MSEYKGKEQKEQQQQQEAMDIFGHELIPLQEDEDINNFITELFDENNTLPKCELDQWLEDYLEEMEIQQQQQGEKKKSQEKSLLDMCQYSDISSVEEEEEEKENLSGQCKENKDENYDGTQVHHEDNLYNCCNCIFCNRSTIYEEQGGNIGTEPVTIQFGGGLSTMYGDQQQQQQQQQQQDYEQEEEEKEKEEEELDDDLFVNVFNFPSTFFFLKLERTKSFKHKQDEIVNEQSYIVGLKENVITRNVTLGDIHNQLYLLFHSLLEEIHNVYTHQDLVRVYIMHDEMVNTNIIVGPIIWVILQLMLLWIK